MIKHRFAFFVVLVFIFVLIFDCRKGWADINSASITADTLEALPHCIHYRIRGMCYWANINGINTTPYIEQYLPDLVVSVFNKPDDNPWLEAKDSYDKTSKIAEKEIVSSITEFNVGDGNQSLNDVHEQYIFFKEADVVGNPALIALPTKIGFLPSSATPLFPYYSSLFDAAAWRGLPEVKTTLAEEAYAVIANVSHHVGTFTINWGGIYPHEGKVASDADLKASEVIAQRATDLTTSTNPIAIGHIYHKLSNKCGQECKATAIEENSKDTLFQMIYPIKETRCDYFGRKIDSVNKAQEKSKGNYVWVVWRRYEGCQDGDGAFIGKTIIN